MRAVCVVVFGDVSRQAALPRVVWRMLERNWPTPCGVPPFPLFSTAGAGRRSPPPMFIGWATHTRELPPRVKLPTSIGREAPDQGAACMIALAFLGPFPSRALRICLTVPNLTLVTSSTAGI